jgi:hypothetical protein
MLNPNVKLSEQAGKQLVQSLDLGLHFGLLQAVLVLDFLDLAVGLLVALLDAIHLLQLGLEPLQSQHALLFKQLMVLLLLLQLLPMPVLLECHVLLQLLLLVAQLSMGRGLLPA